MRVNKKFYNFTEYQKRRDRSVGNQWNTVPKGFVRGYNVTFRRYCKHILRSNVLNGTEIPYPLSGRHTARWDYW